MLINQLGNATSIIMTVIIIGRELNGPHFKNRFIVYTYRCHILPLAPTQISILLVYLFLMLINYICQAAAAFSQRGGFQEIYNLILYHRQEMLIRNYEYTEDTQLCYMSSNLEHTIKSSGSFI